METMKIAKMLKNANCLQMLDFCYCKMRLNQLTLLISEFDFAICEDDIPPLY